MFVVFLFYAVSFTPLSPVDSTVSFLVPVVICALPGNHTRVDTTPYVNSFAEP